MANEFVAKNGLISQNNTTVSGSLTVTQNITSSNFAFTYLDNDRFVYNNGVLRYNTGENTEDIVVYNPPKANHHLIVDGDNDYVILQRESGNVGIGTSTPSAKLDVSGSVLITGGVDVIDRLKIFADQTSPMSGSLQVGTDSTTGFVYIRPSGLTGNLTSSKLEFVNRGSNGTLGGLYNTVLENYERSTRLLTGQYHGYMSFGRVDSPYMMSIIPVVDTAGSLGDIMIGTPIYNTPPTSSGFRLQVTGSGNSGSFAVNNVLKVIGTSVLITGSLNISQGITGSLSGLATSASYVDGDIFTETNLVLSSSYALTASYAMNGGSGGGGGITQGQVVAIATGYSNLF